MRVLYYVPMIHTPQELGSLKESAIAAHKQRYGNRQTEEFFKQVEWYWREVSKRIQKAGLFQPETASRLHIFVDGLPNTEKDRVQKIIQELTNLDIPVYNIIKKLQENGAKVHGTENRELLLQEHQYWIGVAKGKKAEAGVTRKLLKARDQAIARRINEELPEKEIGLLFIGGAHNVIGELAERSGKFKVIYL